MLAADSVDVPRRKMTLSTRLIHITAQLLLNLQLYMGKISRLTNPLLLHKSLKPSAQPFVQVFNQSGNHWVVASNIGWNVGCVRSYDSSCKKETDEATDKIPSKLLQTSESLMMVEVMNVQQQRGGSNCRVIAVAFATSIVFGQCLTL